MMLLNTRWIILEHALPEVWNIESCSRRPRFFLLRANCRLSGAFARNSRVHAGHPIDPQAPPAGDASAVRTASHGGIAWGRGRQSWPHLGSPPKGEPSHFVHHIHYVALLHTCFWTLSIFPFFFPHAIFSSRPRCCVVFVCWYKMAMVPGAILEGHAFCVFYFVFAFSKAVVGIMLLV